MTKPNRFASLIEAAKEGPEVIGDDQVAAAAFPVKGPELEGRPQEGMGTPPPALPPTGSTKGPGRPRGKRSDPAFEQVSARIPSKLYEDVKIAIIKAGRRQDFSEVVAELLTGWLDNQPTR